LEGSRPSQTIERLRDDGRIDPESARGREEFSLPGFYHRLAKWIAVGEQVCRGRFLYRRALISSSLSMLLDCSELLDLLLFIGAKLKDEAIPHRTKTSQLIATRFQVEYDK
jgi:hypothetical protein